VYEEGQLIVQPRTACVHGFSWVNIGWHAHTLQCQKGCGPPHVAM